MKHHVNNTGRRRALYMYASEYGPGTHWKIMRNKDLFIETTWSGKFYVKECNRLYNPPAVQCSKNYDNFDDALRAIKEAMHG